MSLSKTIGNQSQDPLKKDIILDLYPGFEGYYKFQKWFPLTVVAKNNGTYFRGDLIVKSVTYGNQTPIIVKKYIELPGNTPKKIQLYLSPEFASSWQDKVLVELVDTGGKLCASWTENIKQLGQEQTLLLVLSGDKAGLNYLNGPQTNLWPKSNLMVLYPDSSNLPREWIGYEGVDIIIINNFSITDSLDELQRKSLGEWVQSGGKLLVSSCGHPVEFSNTFLEEALPVAFQSNVLLPSIDGLTNYAGASLNIEPPGISIIKSSVKTGCKNNVTVEEENIPVITNSYYGNGKITFLAFDISKEPFKNWNWKMKFWGKALSELYLNSFLSVHLSTDDINNVLYNIPSMKPPSFNFIGFYLFFYILLAGPLNYFILKKFDKREFAVITIPVMVVLFSLGTYIIGYTSKGGSVILRQISVVNMNCSSTISSIDTFIGLFSPNKSTYRMGFPDSNVWAYNIVKDERMEMISREDDKNSIENIVLNMWSMVGFKGSSISKFPGRLYLDTMDVKIDSPDDMKSLGGVIVNETGKTIHNACFLYNSCQIGYIGELARGKNSVQVNFKTFHSASDLSKDWINNCKLDLNKSEDQIKKNLSDKVLENLHKMPCKGLLLCGWNEESLIDIDINRQARHEYINLFLFHISLDGQKI
jgi:hypothetical protein